MLPGARSIHVSKRGITKRKTSVDVQPTSQVANSETSTCADSEISLHVVYVLYKVVKNTPRKKPCARLLSTSANGGPKDGSTSASEKGG